MSGRVSNGWGGVHYPSAAVRKISSTFLDTSGALSASAESLAALRAMPHGTGATLPSAEVPSLPPPPPSQGRCGQDSSDLLFPANDSIFSSCGGQ